jgi:hypothetical protein
VAGNRLRRPFRGILHRREPGLRGIGAEPRGIGIQPKAELAAPFLDERGEPVGERAGPLGLDQPLT